MVQRKKLLKSIPAIGLAAGMALTMTTRANASSHREAPAISEDPVADLTDVYAFVSPDNAAATTLVIAIAVCASVVKANLAATVGRVAICTSMCR